MSEKLKALTDKIYLEGIEKAKQESENLISSAQQKAKKIVDEANNKANEIITKANDEAESHKKKVEAEIKLASQKAIATLKQQISGLITENIIEKPVAQSFNNPETTAKILVTIAQALRQVGGTWRFELNPIEIDKISKLIESEKIDLFNKGFTIQQNENVTEGFQVLPENNQYTLRFNHQVFSEFLSGFLKIETTKIILNK